MALPAFSLLALAPLVSDIFSGRFTRKMCPTPVVPGDKGASLEFRFFPEAEAACEPPIFLSAALPILA
jgi:hypothetical protein